METSGGERVGLKKKAKGEQKKGAGDCGVSVLILRKRESGYWEIT